MITFFISLLSYFRSKSHVNYTMKPKTCPPLYNTELSTKNLVFDVEGGLLRSSTFPYFMLVALEGGGFLRGLLLLLAYPLVCCLSQEIGIRVMVMISFCGLKKSSFAVGKVVLPKFLLEDVGLEGFEVMRKGKRRVCVSRMPRVMVEWFLKELLEVEMVVARELKVFHGFYTGLMEEYNGYYCKVEDQIDDGLVGVLSATKFLEHPLFTQCKEIYLVTEAEKRKWHPLPRHKYPKPLIFHDGRIAFKPNPLNTTLMFLWLPIGLPLSILRTFIGIIFPYNLGIPLLILTGMQWKIKGSIPPKHKAHLFDCNHRTLLDPLYIAAAIRSPVIAVTYGLSKISELLSPIKVVRLTRNREIDRKTMGKLLSQGKNLVICPEGTTCREPYLLRFSPLFAELTDEIVPVAINVGVSMFYATTVGGFKGFDSFYFCMNPQPCYELEFLDKIDTSKVKVGECSSIEMANLVQGVIGKALGFECTKLSRKDKYMMLAGNNGIVTPSETKSKNKPKLKAFGA